LGLQFNFYYELEVTNQRDVGKTNNNTFQTIGNNLQQTINPSIKCMKIIAIHPKAHTRKKRKKTYEYKTSSF
jgi:hypothetical protein